MLSSCVVCSSTRCKVPFTKMSKSYVPILLTFRNTTFMCSRQILYISVSLEFLWSLLKSLATCNNCNDFKLPLLSFKTVSVKIVIKNSQ